MTAEQKTSLCAASTSCKVLMNCLERNNFNASFYTLIKLLFNVLVLLFGRQEKHSISKNCCWNKIFIEVCSKSLVLRPYIPAKLE